LIVKSKRDVETENRTKVVVSGAKREMLAASFEQKNKHYYT
jgi:hypothetical protein